MHTYTRIHIGKQGIYRLHDQYGGQTHRHPPGEGQLNLRNFVLPSILPGSFFQQTRRRRGGWRRDGSARFRGVEPNTRRGHINCEFFFPTMAHIQRDPDHSKRRRKSRTMERRSAMLPFASFSSREHSARQGSKKFAGFVASVEERHRERTEIKIYIENDISNCRIKSIARCERTIDGS